MSVELPYVEVTTDKPPQAWIAVAAAWFVVGAFFVRVLVAQVAHGAGLGPVVVLGLAFLLLSALLWALWKVELVVVVEPGRLTWSYDPVGGRSIDLDEVRWAQAVRYRPIRDFLGWGIRWTPWAGWAITLSGQVGVKLALHSGRTVLIGSPNAMRLLEAVEAARGAAPGDEPNEFDDDTDDEFDDETDA